MDESTIGCKDFWKKKKMLCGQSNLLSFLCHLYFFNIIITVLLIQDLPLNISCLHFFIIQFKG